MVAHTWNLSTQETGVMLKGNLNDTGRERERERPFVKKYGAGSLRYSLVGRVLA